MKKTIKQNSSSFSQPTPHQRPELKVIEGGAAPVAERSGSAIEGGQLRAALVNRARDRVEAGYYERQEVVDRLVDLLWDEFYSR